MKTIVVPQDVPQLSFGNFGQFTPHVGYLASVHFETLKKSIGMLNYLIPACPDKDTVQVLPIYDTYLMVRQAIDPMEEPIPTPQPCSLQSVIQSLLQDWTSGFIGLAGSTRPGIMQIKGPEPTPEEYEQMLKMEDAHCKAWVREADTIHITGKGRISSKHIGAAKWLNLHLTGVTRPWLTGQSFNDFKIGAASGKQIPMKALVDEGIYLPEFYTKHSLDPLAFGDHHIYQLLITKGDVKVEESPLPEDPSDNEALNGIEIEDEPILVGSSKKGK